MIYYVGYHESEDHWTSNFNRAVVSELDRRQVPYRELPPADWATGPVDPEPYRRAGATDQDTWLIGWAQSPVVDALAKLPGQKLAFVVGIYGMPYEPACLRGGPLPERERLARLDGILCVSHWCRSPPLSRCGSSHRLHRVRLIHRPPEGPPAGGVQPEILRRETPLR